MVLVRCAKRVRIRAFGGGAGHQACVGAPWIAANQGRVEARPAEPGGYSLVSLF